MPCLEVAPSRLKCQLAGSIVAGCRSESPEACLRWLPAWLPKNLVSSANGRRQGFRMTCMPITAHDCEGTLDEGDLRDRHLHGRSNPVASAGPPLAWTGSDLDSIRRQTRCDLDYVAFLSGRAHWSRDRRPVGDDLHRSRSDHGQAVIAGTRVPASVILDCLATGMTAEEITADPSVTVAGVRAAADQCRPRRRYRR